jgi:excinuclease UvrABC ATPase subunit
MDIDRLTTEEQAQHMREGRCFECHGTGHTARDHRNGNIPNRKPNQNRPPSNNRFKGNSTNRTPNTDRYKDIPKNANSYTAAIRTMLSELDEDERAEAIEGINQEEEVVEEDF